MVVTTNEKLNTLHPQPSSYRKCSEAIKRANIRGKTVLDCFCGTGKHVWAAAQAGADLSIGTDIEDWNLCLYSPLSRYMKNKTLFDNNIILKWRVNALDSCKTAHDVLFIDPPNPYSVNDGCMLADWRKNKNFRNVEILLSPENYIKTGKVAINSVRDLIISEQGKGIMVIVNLFSTSQFDYASCFYHDFGREKLFESYYRITEVKT